MTDKEKIAEYDRTEIYLRDCLRLPIDSPEPLIDRIKRLHADNIDKYRLMVWGGLLQQDVVVDDGSLIMGGGTDVKENLAKRGIGAMDYVHFTDGSPCLINIIDDSGLIIESMDNRKLLTEEHREMDFFLIPQ